MIYDGISATTRDNWDTASSYGRKIRCWCGGVGGRQNPKAWWWLKSGTEWWFSHYKTTIHTVTFNYGNMGTADFNETLGTYWWYSGMACFFWVGIEVSTWELAA